MASAVFLKFTKRGVDIESIAVGRKFRRRPRRNPEEQPRLVVVEVRHGSQMSSFDKETCAIHSSDNYPKLHSPHVFGASCLETFRFVRKAGFPDAAKLLIAIPIEVLGNLPLLGFEKLGVAPSLGADLQQLLRDRQPAKTSLVKPIGPAAPPPNAAQAPTFRTVDEFLRVAEGFTHFENPFRSMPIGQFQALSQSDFQQLRVSCVVGLFMQNMIRRAQDPKPFSLF
jgi:hypothetical protein